MKKSTQHSPLELVPFDNSPIGEPGSQGPRTSQHQNHQHAGPQRTGLNTNCSDADLVS